MPVSFYSDCEDQANDIHKDLVLEVSVFNAGVIFTVLGIQGETENGTVGSLNKDECIKALGTLRQFILVNQEIYNPLGMSRLQYQRYTNSLFFLLGYCIGRDCKFCWS